MVVDDTFHTADAPTVQNTISENLGDAPHIATVTAPSLHIKLSKIAFQGHSILENLILDLAGGEITCLLGPSGAGKTSILKAIAGLLPMEEGSSITAEDKCPLAGRIAYMDQNDLLLPWANVLENVVISARLNGLKPNMDRAQKILDDVGLGNKLTEMPDNLSGGMRQRVALARTLMDDHPIVLVDEPFSALDAITRHRLQALMVKMLKGRTVLMITHDPMEALRISHHIFVLSGNPVLLSPPLHMSGDIPRIPTDEALRPRLNLILSMLGLTREDR